MKDDIIAGHKQVAEKAIRELAAAQHKLELIRQWCEAYPLAVFPEPDLKKAQRVLSRHGMSLDAISASNMRHVLNGIRKIIEEVEP